MDQHFYFTAAAAINVSKGHRYSLNFYNQGRHKLVSFEVKYITEQTHVGDKLSSEDTDHFGDAMKTLQRGFDRAIGQFRRLWVVSIGRTKDVSDLSSVYYWYEVG